MEPGPDRIAATPTLVAGTAHGRSAAANWMLATVVSPPPKMSDRGRYFYWMNSGAGFPLVASGAALGQPRTDAAARAAAGSAEAIRSTAVSSCAADTNQASNADGGRYTPASSIPWKNAA